MDFKQQKGFQRLKFLRGCLIGVGVFGLLALISFIGALSSGAARSLVIGSLFALLSLAFATVNVLLQISKLKKELAAPSMRVATPTVPRHVNQNGSEVGDALAQMAGPDTNSDA
ncbi:MAG: hypothetical protein GVY16_05385 [Planctomycetes bacterium]|nr:hypothetical protein [Planctomycetota bacterium]